MAEKPPRGRGLLPDAAIALVAAAVAGVAFSYLGGWLPAELANPRLSNVWFDADVPTVWRR